MKKVIIILSLIVIALTATAQQRKTPFNGQLLDLNGKPIKSARVYIRDHRAYCTSDKQGNFGLTDVNPTDTLRILIKKKLYSVPVDGKKSIRIRLADEKNFTAEQDEQLISIGYGHVKRRERTNAAEAFVSGKQLQDAGARTIIEGLMGRVPGLVVTYENGQAKATMRGTRTLTGESEPLYIIDGIISPTLDGINIFDVDYIEVMREASIYGSQGANGAIIVYTKK